MDDEVRTYETRQEFVEAASCGREEGGECHFEFAPEGRLLYYRSRDGDVYSAISLDAPDQGGVLVSMLKRAAMKLWDGVFYGTGLLLVAVWVVVVFEVVGRVTVE